MTPGRPPAGPAALGLGLALLWCAGCGGDEELAGATGVHVEPYVDDGPLDAALRRCLALGGVDFEPCDLDSLPPLAREVGTPTTDDVARRLLVSHPWMGDRLLAVLEAAPEALAWSSSITGIVAGAGIAPSFLSLRTGAIYLDPRHLAITDEEWLQASGGEDPRGQHAQDLRFSTSWGYAVPADAQGIDALLPKAAAVLYHELAHALDRFPPDALVAADGATPLRPLADARYADSVSGRLPDAHPLQAGPLFELTRVTVDGDEPSEAQRAYTAEQAAADFAGDVATDFYAYFDPQEDVALLIEELQVARHFGVRRQVSVHARGGGEGDGETAQATWTQRGRIGDPAIRARLRWVVENLLPSGVDEALEAVDRLPAPTP